MRLCPVGGSAARARMRHIEYKTTDVPETLQSGLASLIIARFEAASACLRMPGERQ